MDRADRPRRPHARPPSRCCGARPTRSPRTAAFADDLDADSLDLVELVMALEDRFDVDVARGRPRRASRTVGDAVDLVLAASAANA